MRSSSSTSVTFFRLGLPILLLAICVGPFFQGYFFPTPALVAMAVTAGTFALWAVGRRMQRLALNLPGDRVGILFLAFVAWCLLVTAWAVYVRGHLTLILQVATAFAAFALMRAENSDSVRQGMVWALSLSAVIVAVLGLLEYSGFFVEHVTLGNLLQVEPQRDRLYTVFQYPNSAAIFFLVVLLLQHSRLFAAEAQIEKTLLAAASAIIATAFALTLSRGSILVAPIGVLLLWMGMSMRQIFPSLLYWVTAAGIPVALAVRPITQAALAAAWPTVLLWALIAALAGAVATGLLQVLLRLPGRMQVITGVALLSILLVGGAVVAPRALTQLPAVFSRVSQLSLGDITRDGRFEFLRDAGRLAARRPWGYGGGGWLRTYTQVQQYNYVARDPHSQYTLTLVETGVPGLALLLGTIGLAAFQAFRIRRSDPLRWGMAVAAITLAGHAALDIDLSYYAMWLLLWTLLGAAQPELRPLPLKKEHPFTFPAALTSAAAVVLVCATFLAAARSYATAEAAVLVGDNNSALEAGNRAIRLDPLNSQYRTMIPTSHNINRALALDPQNEELWRFVADLLEEQGDTAGALAAAQRALQLRPMSVSHYERVADLLVRTMTTALEEGRTTEAAATAKEIIALGHDVETRGEASLEKQKLVFPAYPALTWTPHLNLAVGQACLVAGETADAEARLQAALASKETAADAALWLYALYTREGDRGRLADLEPKPSTQELNSRLYAALLSIR